MITVYKLGSEKDHPIFEKDDPTFGHLRTARQREPEILIFNGCGLKGRSSRSPVEVAKVCLAGLPGEQ